MCEDQAAGATTHYYALVFLPFITVFIRIQLPVLALAGSLLAENECILTHLGPPLALFLSVCRLGTRGPRSTMRFDVNEI